MNDARLTARLAAAWSRLSHRRPWLPLTVAALLTAVALPSALTMRLDTDIKRMLPDDSPVVQEMETATAKVGGVGYFSVLAEHDDPDTAIRFIEAMAARVEAHPQVRAVIHENPVDFVREHQLLYVPQAELRELREVVEKERLRLNPFYVDLRTDDEKRAAAEHTTRKLERVRELRRPIDGMTRHHTSADGRVVAMQVRPRSAVTRIGLTRDIYQDLQREAAALKAEGGFPSDLQVHVSGSLRNKVDEYKAIVADIGQSAWLSALLVLAMLLILFRKPVRLVALTAPLLIGMSWAFGFAAAAIGYLNIITATLMVILFGLGIDHGIHLLERYLAERADGAPVLDALTATLTQTGRATTVSALTTAGGFLVMIGTDFKGFSHLGLIAGVSMLTIIAAYLLTLPALLTLLERRGWLIGATPAAPPRLDWKARAARSISARLMAAPTWIAPALAALLVVTGSVAATSLEFNDDFGTLLARHADQQEVRAKQQTVYRHSLTPGAVMIAPDAATADRIVAELKRRRARDHVSPTLGRIVSRADALPANQEARLAEIHAIAARITPAMVRRTEDPERRAWLSELRAARDLDALAWGDLPESIRNVFTPQDGSDDHMIFIFPAPHINRKDGAQARMFAADLSPVVVDGVDYHATGDALILATMLGVVLDQGVWVFVLALLASALLLLVQLRSLRHTLIALVPLGLGLALMATLLHLAEVSVNFYNMAIFAAVVGIGVDSAIHLTNRWLELGGEHTAGAAQRALADVGGPVTASVLTTVVGYVTLAASSHPGLQSIGQLAFIGIGSCYLASVTLFPLLLKGLEPDARPQTAQLPAGALTSLS